MKIEVEVKTENKVTKYSADFKATEKAAKDVADKFENFLKSTFSKEVLVKETKDVNELKQK